MENTKITLPPEGSILTENIKPSLKSRIKYYLFMLDTSRFIKRFLSKVEKNVSGTIYGTKIFLRQSTEPDCFKLEIRIYSKVGEQWSETIVSKQSPRTDIPAEFQERLSESDSLDITDYFVFTER